MEMTRWITTDEAIKIVRPDTSRSFISVMVRQGKILAQRNHRGWRVSEEDCRRVRNLVNEGRALSELPVIYEPQPAMRKRQTGTSRPSPRVSTDRFMSFSDKELMKLYFLMELHPSFERMRGEVRSEMDRRL